LQHLHLGVELRALLQQSGDVAIERHTDDVTKILSLVLAQLQHFVDLGVPLVVAAVENLHSTLQAIQVLTLALLDLSASKSKEVSE
jgi:hypothetical protein